MSTCQCCQPPQSLTVLPESTLGPSLDQGFVLETLNLHATAINTALQRILALEAKCKELEAKSRA
jgi:hypothetical protein